MKGDHMEPMTREEFFALVEDIYQRIHASDSIEGYLNWLIPDEDDPDDIVARVEARYRVGNRDGSQGGMRMIGVKINRGGEDGRDESNRTVSGDTSADAYG